MKMLVTGGAGFIGSNFVELALKDGDHSVVVLDALTYAGHPENLTEFTTNPRYTFVRGDIRDGALVSKLLAEHQINAIVNFAAESHVDRSIEGPRAFLDTNITGTFELLQAARKHHESLSPGAKNSFRFVHVSTDEVFGTLGMNDPAFEESTPYSPNSPYSASKAASDHLVRAWFHTYGLPTIITNCSNNYGPKQFPEKLIPHMIYCALSGNALPVYGKGENIRDWIYVKDHCAGVLAALKQGRPGESYCFGGRSERKNIDVVRSLCSTLDELAPRGDGNSYETQIQFVKDRPGHDLRYAINDAKAERELRFTRSVRDFEAGLKATVQWYLSNIAWSRAVLSKGSKLTYDWDKIRK